MADGATVSNAVNSSGRDNSDQTHNLYGNQSSGMEILHKFKQNGYTVDLYNLLEKKMLTDIVDEIIPSVYEKEMKMSTQERLQSLNTIELSNIVAVGDKKPGKVVLQFTPKILVFQNYKPGEKVVTKFSIRNISHTPIHMNMVHEESLYFFVKPCPPQALSRIAPGMSVSYSVTFIPTQCVDYTHQVLFQTDVDRYLLPLIAMGPRPLFKFPDEITLPKVPLKVESVYNLTVSNIGMATAGFTLKTKCPFSVYPKSAYLSPNQKISLRIGFNSMHLGLAAGIMNVIFETGEVFRIKLFGSTHMVSIELEKPVVRFSDTYNTLARQQTYKITNKSEHTLNFLCMKNDSVFSDFEEKLKLAIIFYDLKQSESGKYQKLVHYDVLSSDEHERIYTRIFFDEIQALIADETLFFQNTHFSITPIKGKLWPNKATELTITFNPKEIGEFEATTFFDIDGIPDRILLKMTGASLPPNIHLNVETLDMDNVYINTTYHYEILAINNGHITGVITYNETKPLFGSTITCTPEKYCLRPGDKEVFVISFCNSNQGPFFEEIHFGVRDTNVVLKLYLKGTVIYPSVLFSVPCLDFGRISLGVPTVLELDIINESVVDIKGSLKISSDGPEISSYTLKDCEVTDKLEPPKWPREFNIEPCKIEIEPESHITVKVTLTANLVRSNQTYLEFELDKSDSPPITLPVTFHAMVPEITPAPDIRLRACFLDCSYQENIVISTNGFAGYYTIEEQSENETLRVDIKNKRCYIAPNSTIVLPATITTSDLGQQEYTVRMYLFGMSKPLEICHVYGLGVRPIVTCVPMSCHWGQLKLLTRSQKILTLCNDSPVTVLFKAALLNRDGRWTVSPTEGKIDPEKETELLLSLYLVDADTYTNKVVIHLEKVKDILVPLSATGVGTSILVGEHRDKILLGRHFTRIPLNCTITVENCGTRVHNLDWSEYYKPPKTKHLTPHFFSMEPRSLKLCAGERMNLTITAVCNKVTTIKELWYLIGSVEGLNKKELLLECPVMAEFVEPRVEISATFLDFRYDSGPHSDYYRLTDILSIKNISKLPLDIEINIRPPFAMIQKQTYKVLPEDENMTCGCIYYDQADLNMKNMLRELGHQQSKHYIDYLTLQPVAPLRQGSLDFFEDINKIKAAFHLTHTVEEKLEDQEIMKIQLLFDTTKHLNMKTKIYCDIMKIKFKGHKNKDAVKLIGKVNFPNIFVALPKVDFRCIINGSVESKTIKIQNLTPLVVCYRFQWKKCCIAPAVVPQMHILDAEHHLAIKTSAEETDIYLNDLHEAALEESPGASMNKIATGLGSALKGSRFTMSLASHEFIEEYAVMKTKHLRKIVPMLRNDFYEPFFPWIHKLPQLIKYKNININDVLQVTPHRGMLKPNEIQNVHIIFRPTDNINVRATLECEVLGGPSELITVTGQSSDLMYSLNTHKLNFKIRSFHEQASENLILTNIAPLVFEYTTYLNEPVFETELDGTILEIVPPQKQLESDEETEIKIIMRPGILGYFNRTFLLEIGHLPCLPIEVFGWGVIPQIYLSLMRPEVAKLPSELGYQAISNLTTEYLLAVVEIFKGGVPEHMNSPQLERCFEDPDLQDDWHLCSAWDDYPTTMDIELAIERLQVVQHVRYRPDILAGYAGGKTGTIPGFHTTSYEINFGVVITGSQVQCVADVINYGPMMTKLMLAKYCKIPVWLTVKLCNKLNPGETGKMEVVFTPTTGHFPHLENNVETSLYLEVPYGVTIPVHIKGLCAVPYLTSNVTELDLGSVQCGHKIVRSIALKNVGKPTCIWYVTLRLKSVGPNPMTILDSSGKYEPGEGGWLSIAFKPTMEMTYEALLIFRFHMNPNRLVIPVAGQGVIPHVHVIGPNMRFPPTLPWADTTEMYFGLTNPCPFPIEVIVAHCDDKWNEEDEIYQFLLKYYNKPEEMLVPSIKPGAGYPCEVINFYKKFKENVRRAKEEEATAAQKAASTKHAVPKKAKPSPRMSRGRSVATAATNTGPLTVETPPKRFRTEAEIVADEIKSLREQGHDPLKECTRVFDHASTKSSIEKYSKGVMIFLHGSPCEEMQCKEIAYSLGKALGIPTVNIDNCIVDALRLCSGSTRQMLMTTLNEMHEAATKLTMNKVSSVVQDESTETPSSRFEDEHDIIWKKIEFLSNSKYMGTPRSKVSDKKKTPSVSHTVVVTSSLFPLDLIQYLLIDYFNLPKFNLGFVVDTLTSMIVKAPQTLLATVLKCKPSIRNVHLVLCQMDFAKWAQAFEESQREADTIDESQSKVYNESEIEQIISSFEEMDDEELEKAPQELKAIYIAYGLEDRRRKHALKTGFNPDFSKKTAKEASKSVIPVIPSQSTKKIKKDDIKGKFTNPEYVLMSNKYADYVKNVHDNILHVAANWIFEEGEVGYPLYTITGQLVGATQKKAKFKKSELQLQLSAEVVLSDRGFPITLINCACLKYKDAVVNMFRNCQAVKEALKEEKTQDILECDPVTKEFTVLMPKTMPIINHEIPLTWLFLEERPIKKCECNQITDLNLLDDSNQENLLNILSKWHCTCGKKVTSSQTSTTDIPSVSVEKIATEEEEEIYPLPLRSVKAVPGVLKGDYGTRVQIQQPMQRLKPSPTRPPAKRGEYGKTPHLREAHVQQRVAVQLGRLVLNPGDLVRLKYTFKPTVEGNFSEKRYVEVSGWPDSRADISVSGICDLPRLDNRPKKMFANFVRRTIDDNVYKITYLDDAKLFQFGPIFVGANRVYEEEYTIDLKNSSLMTAHTEIEFLEETSIFQINKNFIELEPGCRGKVTISAAPHVVGTHTSVLLFCIKDNPEIVEVTFTCSGVLPTLEILPQFKIIDYGKLLLYRRADDRFIIKNDSILPIMWKISNPEDFMDNFIIAQTSGTIQRYDNKVVPITYIACNVGVIENLALTINIYDEHGRGAPLFVDTLFLSAECYDVLVECAYENPQENFLNYGNVKVNSTVFREMYLLNRGKYNIYYKLKKVKKFPEPSLLKSFNATPDCGVLLPSMRLEIIDFECTPTTSMNLHSVPVYNCSLLDGNKDQVVVAKFPVCVTIASFYNTFTLFPLGELNFHIIPVGSGVMREVTLNNTSKCPFTYEIILPSKYAVPTEDQAVQTPTTTVSKEKNTKIKVAPLKCGNFLIVNEDNLLAPGASRIIQIQFLATSARMFEETIHFVISDTCPAEAQGVPLKLVGTGAMPTLDFWNVENTFREHLIVKNLDEYKVHLPAPHCVFAEKTVTLHFFCVTVNTTYAGVVDLANNGVVPSAISMKLIHQANTNSDIFSLDKYECCVEPFMHKKINIKFSPKSLQEYRAVLEIRLKTLRAEQSVFKLCIIGEGVIPRIRIISPVIRQNKLAVLQYPLTCLGSVSNRVIRFKNISAVMSTVIVHIVQPMTDKRPLFWMATDETTECIVVSIDSLRTKVKLLMKPDEVAKLRVTFNPLKKGRTSCDVKITIVDNPYEYYTVLCEAEAFMEDVILLGLDMLSMEMDVSTYKSSMSGTPTSGSTPKRPLTKSAPVEKDKDKKKKEKHKSSKKTSEGSVKQSGGSTVSEPSVLKYTLDFGGCELCTIQKRSVIMANNSEKVYKFTWSESDYVIIKPSVGYISPGEEKDLEIIFFSASPVAIKLESLNCLLIAISDDSLAMDIKGVTWDNRQTITLFEHNKEVDINERAEKQLDEQTLIHSEDLLGMINMIVLYSASTEYSKYKCDLPEDMILKDTFIYKTRTFSFSMENIGNVPMKITWNFNIDDEYPARIDKKTKCDVPRNPPASEGDTETDNANAINKNGSKETLFSGGASRDSVDTWFEVDLPFKIEPDKVCLKTKEKCKFNVTFSPMEAFDFKVRLTSSIDNLDPYDQNACCKIMAKSRIPYVHLDIEETDYLTARRKSSGVTLPHHLTVLEFNVLGSGCFKKEFSVINPTSEGYEFTFEQPESEKPELVPVHCNMLKGYVEGGTSTEVTFTFSPNSPGIYESLWKFIVNAYNVMMPLMVVGIVREPDVMFDPTILIITNSLVGFTTTHEVKLRNNENQSLNFEFKGNSLINETGKTPIVLSPEKGVLKACSENIISINYTPITDGPSSFKIFCNIAHLVKQLILCVTALSHSINPTVTYTMIGNKHVLKSGVVTNIHFDQTASTYERKVIFTIRNDGSATFLFEWRYNNSAVKKYLDVQMEPRSGHVTPANELECTLFFTLRQVPVHAFPLKLLISDGPEFNILLNADIMKPMYHFSCKILDFGQCLVLAPEATYQKSIAFYNEENYPVMLNMNFTSLPELYVDFETEHEIKPKKRVKIPLYFRPKLVKQYEMQLPFSVNSLCEEVVTVRGEGVPLLIDLYEGCQKSFDLGPVRVGEKCIRQIEVMNHSKVSIDTTFVFQNRNEMKVKDKEHNLPDDNVSEVTSLCLNPTNINVPQDTNPSRVDEMKLHREEGNKRQIEIDTKNALASLRVVPSRYTIKPYEKVPLKIHFKPIDMISTLNVQLNAKVLRFVRPLVLLSGSATGMKLSLSQNSIQFGRVRKRGCRVMKVMLKNEGDFNTRFCWQPLVADEFTITPMQGNIDARTNVTFTITFRPTKENPFIKVWACCNIDNHRPLELAIHATCIDTGIMQCRNLYMDCPVREVNTDYISIQNPTDDSWYILSEISEGPFETLSEFTVEPNQTFDVPLHFKPKKIGQYETQVLYSPLGETALFLTVIAVANHPNPNGNISISVHAKELHTEILPVYNITEEPEKYIVGTEVTKIVPDKFEGYYEFKHPETVRVWGEAKCSCRWSVICFQECQMEAKVMFVNAKTREYQFYNVSIAVGPSHHVAHVSYVARARESCSQEIVIRNPLNEDITFDVECERLQVPETVHISANSSAELSMIYSPLVVGESEDTLRVSNPLVGTYTYKVTMRCIPAKEKDIEFTTPLGTCIPMRLRAQNRTTKKADFTPTIYHPCIAADKELYSLAPLEKGKFLFWFEPTDLGVQRCKVSIDSETAGEFVYNITGIATEPKPQGPYEIKVGSFTTIVFKNIFDDTRTFKIFVDRDDFSWKIQPPVEPIKTKKEMRVLVYLSEKAGRAAPPTGCLTIECLEPPEPRVQWTYFLQGI